MTDPIDHSARIREIEARLEAATPGPWRWEFCGDDVCDCAALSGEHYGDVLFLSAGYSDDRIPAKPEYTLIENAPADLRYLLDRVRAQSERIEALEAALGDTNTWLRYESAPSDRFYCAVCLEDIGAWYSGHAPDCIVLTLPAPETVETQG